MLDHTCPFLGGEHSEQVIVIVRMMYVCLIEYNTHQQQLHKLNHVCWCCFHEKFFQRSCVAHNLNMSEYIFSILSLVQFDSFKYMKL